MSTPQTVMAQLQNLLASANSTTGESDTTLTDAVASLIAGFGQGGGAASGLKYTTGSWTQVSGLPEVEHGLGVTPRIFICWLDKPAEEFPLGVAAFGALVVLNLGDGIFSLPNMYTASIHRTDGLFVMCGGVSATNTMIKLSTPNTMAYGLNDNSDGSVFNDTIVKPVRSGSSQDFIDGYTYKWLAIA